MPWDKGFNFRETAAYVTDGANDTYVLGADTYPVTRNSVTFGWVTSAGNARDRTTGNDVRLAGIHFISSTDRRDFRVDLPNTGTFLVGLANGDAGGGQDLQYVDMYDNTTSFNVVDTAAIGVNTFNDATAVNRTAANWPANNAKVTRVFGATNFLTKIAKTTAYGSNHVIAHLSLSESGGGGGGGSTNGGFRSLLGVGR